MDYSESYAAVGFVFRGLSVCYLVGNYISCSYKYNADILPAVSYVA